MTGKEDCYRAAAIRALCTITDPVMLQVEFFEAMQKFKWTRTHKYLCVLVCKGLSIHFVHKYVYVFNSNT